MLRKVIGWIATLDGTFGPKIAAEVCGDKDAGKLSWSEHYAAMKELARVSEAPVKEKIDKESPEFKNKVRALAKKQGREHLLPADY